MALVKELQEIIGTNTRQTDLVTISPGRQILMLMIGVDETKGQTIVERLVQKSRELLSAPLEFNCHVACVPSQVQDFEGLQSLLALEEG